VVTEENAAPKPEEKSPGPSRVNTITLALDDYEDLFSDFDPRPYSERILSEDFLYELKRAAVYKEGGGLALILLLPEERRDGNHEKIILERLKGHFRRHHKRLKAQRKGEIRTGIQMVALGVLLMFLATYILKDVKQTFWTAFIVVLLEPAGWFTLWEGMNLILFHVKEIRPDLEFHQKMSSAKVAFTSPIQPSATLEEKNR
jgi:hypothetical protein